MVVAYVMADIIAFGSYVVSNASTATPAQFTNASFQVRAMTLRGMGRSGSPRTTNTTTVWVGPMSGNDLQPYSVDPGSEVVIQAPPGHWIDMSNWWFDVTTANDGLIVIYQ